MTTTLQRVEVELSRLSQELGDWDGSEQKTLEDVRSLLHSLSLASEAGSDVAAPGSILNAVVEMYDAGIVTNSLEAVKILRKHFS